MKQLLLSLSLLSMATPAFAELNSREEQIYDFAYHYGYLVAMCSSYATGEISRHYFRDRARYIKNHEDTPPKVWRYFLEVFEEATEKFDDTKKCYRVMRVL